MKAWVRETADGDKLVYARVTGAPALALPEPVSIEGWIARGPEASSETVGIDLTAAPFKRTIDITLDLDGAIGLGFDEVLEYQ